MVALMTMPVLSAKKNLSPNELSQRVAVLKRFKELLKAQRDRFRAYLDAMDSQKEVIQNGTADDLLQHVELEEKIVADIFSIQKVIDPLDEMYRSIRADSAGQKSGRKVSSDDEIISLKEALEGLKAEAVVRSEENRGILAKRMAELRSEIKTLKSNPYARPRASLNNLSAPSQIDIKG